jgi:hypothetical protein
MHQATSPLVRCTLAICLAEASVPSRSIQSQTPNDLCRFAISELWNTHAEKKGVGYMVRYALCWVHK